MYLKNYLLIASVCGSLCWSCAETPKEETLKNLTQYVDPYIGTGDHGHVFMGANVPFGLVQLGPSNIPQEWDWTSGYHITDSTIIGFSHMHLSGTGIGDLGDINLMPTTHAVKLARGKASDPESGMYSLFNRDTETTKAGYYAVRLERYGIDVELTATKRVGFHKYTFPASETSRVIIDLENGQCWDTPIDCYIVQENDTVISGYRNSKGWSDNQWIYFTVVFSKPMKEFVVSEAMDVKEGTELRSPRAYGQVMFETQDNEEVYVKVALSPVSIENAKMNMQAELPGWDFNATVAQADQAWNEELNKVVITTNDRKALRTFYTALYHTMIAPSEFCDVNRDYRGSDSAVHRNASFVNYTTFSLWDTYRAAHPLMTIIHPEKVNDIINTMLTIYQQQGKLPVWHLMGCETDCMIGNPAIPVVADAILKGYDGFDKELAFEAMKNSAMLDERGLGLLKEYGYIPYDKGEDEGLSKCMEYALADWSVAQVAKKMGKTEDYEYFFNRSKSYKHYFDPATGFMRGISSKGVFKTPFNPFESVHRDNDYAEGTGWQYIWLVPHDIQGLAELFGSTDKMISKLDSLFVVEGAMGAHASPDITGLIGQYAHGNEPGHHTIYIYPYLGQPWKTAERGREIMDVMYFDEPAGLSGNEDVGQMSAWYVLSALGMYQVEPAGGKYILGSPIVDDATIKINGGTFRIIAHNNSATNKYVQSVKLNGKEHDLYYINFTDIVPGGTLEFTMGSQPSEWATKNEVIRVD